MLSVEARQALILYFETATAAHRRHAHANTVPATERSAAILRTQTACEVAEREFYEYLNLLTDWGLEDDAISRQAART